MYSWSFWLVFNAFAGFSALTGSSQVVLVYSVAQR